MKIDTSNQPADMLIKPLPEITFQKHRTKIMGWYKREHTDYGSFERERDYVYI